MRSRLAFVREVRGEHDFLHKAVCGALDQAVEMDLFRPDTVERTQPSHQHEIQSPIRQCLFEHDLVGRGFDHAEQFRIAFGVVADLANRCFGERIALFAVLQMLGGEHQRAAELFSARPIVLHQMIGHALRRLGTHARQRAAALRRAPTRRKVVSCAWDPML